MNSIPQEQLQQQIGYPDIDGTYGENNEGIFYFTVDGSYKEWNSIYFYSSEYYEIEDPMLSVVTNGEEAGQ